MYRVIAAAITVATALSSPGSAQQPSFRVGTDVVSVFATVLDARGRLVTGLGPADFEIFDNGVRQSLEAFSDAPQPFTMVMLLDRSGSMSTHFGKVRAAADLFIGHLGTADRLRIGTFANSIQIEPAAFTSDTDVLRDLLRAPAQELGESPVWNATAAALDSLASESGRRVILLFTDGHDSTSAPDAVSVGQLRSRLATEEVLVYAVGFTERCAAVPSSGSVNSRVVRLQRGGRGVPPRGPSGPGGGRWPPGPQFPPSGPVLPPSGPWLPPRVSEPVDRRLRCRDIKPSPELRELTEIGGGAYFELDDLGDFDAAFGAVAEELHAQYLLAFAPAVLDDTTHRIEVRVKGTGHVVRARQSYFAGRTQSDGSP